MKPYLIFYLSIIAAGFVTGLSFYKKSDKTIRPVILYLGFNFFLEIINFYMAKVFKNNMPAYHFSGPVQILLLGIFFYFNINNKTIKKAIFFTVIAMIVFAGINVLLFEPINTFPGNVSKTLTIIYICWAGILFMQQMELPATENIFKNPVFIIAVAVLWFNIISFLFFLLYGYLSKNNIKLPVLGTIHYYSNIVYYLLLLSAMIISKLKLNNVRTIQ